MFILHSREIKKIHNFYTHRLPLTPPSNKTILKVTNKEFQLTSSLVRSVKFMYKWSLTNKNEREFTLDDSNSEGD